MQAHVLAHFIDDQNHAFPFLCLTVSGGHTQACCAGLSGYGGTGQTTDDAAGEALDKSSQDVGLPYPGGPLVDNGLLQPGDPLKYKFPLGLKWKQGYQFSFSGLKTSVLYFLQAQKKADADFVSKKPERHLRLSAIYDHQNADGQTGESRERPKHKARGHSRRRICQ